MSFRRDGVWTKPTNLGDKINSVGWDFSPKVSPDEEMVFLYQQPRLCFDKPLWKNGSPTKELLQKLQPSPGNGLREHLQDRHLRAEFAGAEVTSDR